MKTKTTPFLYSMVAAAALPATAQPIAAGDQALVGFATEVVEFLPAPGLTDAVSQPDAALGAPNAGSLPDFTPTGLVSLGDPVGGVDAGTITLGFDRAITNGVGADFAVFENAFVAFNNDDFVFAELAFVEVSTNGTDFARFPTSFDAELDLTFGASFASLDPLTVDGFAGADLTFFGTPFDLEALAADPIVVGGGVDLDEINFVRLIDIPGDGRFEDSSGVEIFDAFAPFDPLAEPPTPLGTGGFDLDAIGVLNQVPEPGTAAALLALAGLAVSRSRRPGLRQ